ncbi:MAG TPA: sensor histidine kinase [Thermoanaerobaculia bacterium]|nr:sensor histidine kinase [Thermoanaerobaculia bacterium]
MRLRLLPDDPEIGWTPYAWLVYLTFPFGYLLFAPAPAAVWMATAGAAVAFLPIYFRGFWLHGRALIAPAAAIAAIGLLLAPVNPGASTFVIYAASFLGQLTPPRLAVRALLALVGVLALVSWALGLHPAFWGPAAVISLLIGGINVHYAEVGRANAKLRLTQQEVERLAQTAERERIARDLHDLLGHTLSLITLKAELAGKLLPRDAAAAGREIREVERISREALREVRSAVSGYRSEGLSAELARARLALETAGVRLEYLVTPLDLEPAQETALGFAVREAVTNVVRHAGARTCRIRLEQDADATRLEVEDDGHGGTGPDGNGLRAMRERIEGLGGTLEHHGGAGTRIAVRLPRRAAASAEAAPVRPAPGTGRPAEA